MQQRVLGLFLNFCSASSFLAELLMGTKQGHPSRHLCRFNQGAAQQHWSSAKQLPHCDKERINVPLFFHLLVSLLLSSSPLPFPVYVYTVTASEAWMSKIAPVRHRLVHLHIQATVSLWGLEGDISCTRLSCGEREEAKAFCPDLQEKFHTINSLYSQPLGTLPSFFWM